MSENIEKMNTIQQQLASWSQLDSTFCLIVDYRITSAALKSNLLKSVDQWTGIQHKMNILREDESKLYDDCETALIQDANRIAYAEIIDNINRHDNPMI